MNLPIYRIEVDTVVASEWSELLERFQDANLYQTWSYGAIRWGEKNLSRLVLRRGGEAVAMAQLRILQTKFLKTGIAYLRWGPVCHLQGAELDPEVVRAAAAAMREEYVCKRKLLLRILPDAFAGSPRGELVQSIFSGAAFQTQNSGVIDRTLVLDLRPSLEALRKKLDQKWRNQLNRAERNSLEISESSSVEAYCAFLEIYREMWARKKFHQGVDVEEFARLQAALPEKERMRVLICRQAGRAVAGIVCSAMGKLGIYLLGATSDNGLRVKGAYLLQWTMVRWLRENGYWYYDLGGIDPVSNPGVYHFKSGFSGEEVCRLPAIEACGNPLSWLGVRVGDVVRRGRDRLSRLRSADWWGRYRPTSNPKPAPST